MLKLREENINNILEKATVENISFDNEVLNCHILGMNIEEVNYLIIRENNEFVEGFVCSKNEDADTKFTKIIQHYFTKDNLIEVPYKGMIEYLGLDLGLEEIFDYSIEEYGIPEELEDYGTHILVLENNGKYGLTSLEENYISKNKELILERYNEMVKELEEIYEEEIC